MSPDLASHAEQLLAQGLTPLRAMRRLRRQFPHAETLDLHEAVNMAHTGFMPLWAVLGHPLRPVMVKGVVKRVDEMRARHA